MQIWEPCGKISGLADIAALEAIPLEQRITEWDINAWLENGLALDPAKPAVIYFEQADPTATPLVWTHGDLAARANRVANLLDSIGVRSNDAVLFLLPTVPDVFTVQLATMARGIACPVNWMLEPAHLLALVRASAAKVVIALGPMPGFEIWEKLQAVLGEFPNGVRVFSVHAPGGTLLPETDLLTAAANQPARKTFTAPRGPSDIVAYIHSGGTTGVPKLVQITSRGLVHKSWAVTMTMAHRPSDVLFADMPPFHIAGFVHCGVLPILLGETLVVPTPLGARDRQLVRNYWKFVERFRISFLHAVPTTLGQLAQHKPTTEDISSLAQYSVTGSTALPVSVAHAIEQTLGIRLVATYGATEFCMNVTQAPRDGEPRYGSAGIRNPYTHIRIALVDRDGHVLGDCAPGEIGAVLIRSPGTTPGYLGQPNDPTVLLDDFWINNGDLGRLDEDGYLWLTGRAKDVIIRGGHNIDPRLPEDALLRHPAVAMAAAVAKPDAYAGELPMAYVQLREGMHAEPAELMEFARAHVSERAAAPAEVVILPELPLTDVRKVNRVTLREDAARRSFTQALTSVPADITVSVGPDPRHGTKVTLLVRGPSRGELETAITAALKGFSLAHEIVWET